MSSEMTTIEVTTEAAEVLRTLQAQAEERRVAFATLLRGLAKQLGETPAREAKLPQEQWEQAFREWVAGHDPNTPVILDDSREALYAEDEQRWTA
jgi:hypothetical protein